MGTTVDKLNKVKDTKAAIKTAIEAKGVTVGDATFAQYPDKIAAISGGGGSGVIETALTNAGLSYFIDELLTVVNRSIALHDTTKNLYQLVGDNNNGGIIYVNGCLPPPNNQTVNYQKSLISVKNVNFSQWAYTQSSGRAFCFNNNLVEFNGVSTAASGEGITDFSGVTYAQQMFAGCPTMKDIKVYLPAATTMDSFCSDDIGLETVTVKTSGQTLVGSYMFNRCYNLKEVTLINELVVSAINGFFYMDYLVEKCTGIINVTGVTNFNQFIDGSGARAIREIWIKGLGSDITIVSPNITKECLLYMFNQAVNVTGTKYVTINTDVYNSLTTEERAIITSKGFTLRGGATL